MKCMNKKKKNTFKKIGFHVNITNPFPNKKKIKQVDSFISY